MARFPKIQQDCPIKTSLDAYIVNDVCSLCEREVHDIGVMSETERTAFMQSCQGEVCVKYQLPGKFRTSAVALSAVLMTLPSAAQDSSPLDESHCAVDAGTHCGDIVFDDEEYVLVIAGGIKTPSDVEYIDTEEDLALPVVPVTYEDTK